jgi:predicted exporter
VAGIARHRRTIIYGSLLGCILAALSVTRLRLDIDVLTMLPHGKPAFDNFKMFIEHFGELNELVVLVHEAPPQTLRRFTDRFAARLSELDSVKRVQAHVDGEQITRGLLGRYLYNYLSDEGYDTLQRRLTPAGIDAQLAADRAMLNAPLDVSVGAQLVEDPFGVRRLAATSLLQSVGGGTGDGDGYLAARDGSALLIIIRPTTSPFDIIFSERFMAQVRAVEAEVRAESGLNEVRVDYTGGYIYALEDKATLSRDVTRYTFLALVAVLLTFLAGYRNLRILPFVTYPLIVTTLVDFAVSVVIFDQLNAVSLAFAAILYGLSIDTAIHFYTRVVQERQQRPLEEAVATTLAALGRATVTAALTTAAVFAVIGLSVLSPVQQLGLMTAMGMLINIGIFFVLYPALALSMAGKPVQLGRLETPGLARIAGASARHPRPVTLATAGFAAICAILATRVNLDATLTHLRPRQSEAMRVQDEIARRFGQKDTDGAVLVQRESLDAALRDAEMVAGQLDRYQADGVVRDVKSVRGVLPSAETQRARLARYAALPRAEAVASLRAALPRYGFATEPFRPFLDGFAASRENLVVLGDDALAPVQPIIEHYVRVRDGIFSVATYVEPGPGVTFEDIATRLSRDAGALKPIVASRALLEAELRRMLRRELVIFLALAIAGNVFLLWRAAGSWRTGTVLMIPALLGVLCVLAGMTVFGIALDPVNLIVLPLILGIGVDDAVYLHAGVRSGLSVEAAMEESGRALVMTSYTEIAGFGCLALSRSPALATMGLLAAAGLLVSLTATIIVLPAALTWWLHPMEGRLRGE